MTYADSKRVPFQWIFSGFKAIKKSYLPAWFWSEYSFLNPVLARNEKIVCIVCRNFGYSPFRDNSS